MLPLAQDRVQIKVRIIVRWVSAKPGAGSSCEVLKADHDRVQRDFPLVWKVAWLVGIHQTS